MSDDDFLLVEGSDCPMSSCAAPAGSPCRTGKGRVAAQYHTARFRLVPRLAKALAVPVPPLRRPGSAWTELPRPSAAGTGAAGHVRIGYARASTVRQSLSAARSTVKGHAAVLGRVSEAGGGRADRRPGQAVRVTGVLTPRGPRGFCRSAVRPGRGCRKPRSTIRGAGGS